MPTASHGFTVSLAGDPPHDDDLANALFEAGCDDGTLWSEGPRVFVDFHREAPTLERALATAVRDVGKAGFAVARVVIDVEDLPALAADDIEPAPAAAGPPAADPAPVAAA